MNSISSEKLYNIIKTQRIILIDLRDKKEFIKKHIYNSINIPYDNFIKNISKYLNHSFIFYFICNTGFLSKQISFDLNKKGYTTISIDGGIDNWKYELIEQ